MKKVYQKEKLRVYLGRVTGDPERIERDGVATASVVLSDDAGEHIKIYFRNNAEKGNMLADRVVRAKVHDGSMIAVLASCSDPEEKTAAGIDFCFSGGMLTVERTSILFGRAYKFRMPNIEGKPKGGMACTSIKVRRNKADEWISVSFFDGEYNGRKTYSASNAKRALADRDGATVVIVGGAITDLEKNGTLYHNMIGYQIYLIDAE